MTLPTTSIPAAESGPDPDVVAAAAVACPLVARLSAGRFGEVASYLPGRRVLGVRVGADRVQVNVVAWYGPTTAEIGDQVRAAVHRVTGGCPVDVVIDDVEAPQPSTPPYRAGAGGLGPDEA